MTAEPMSPGADAMSRTVGYLTAHLSPVQRTTLRALAGRGRAPRAQWTTTYDALTAMGLIDRVGHYGGHVTELGHAVLRRLG